ncbi:MAG: hypothetical protein VZQ96_06980 [Succiniclasticum sp.]|nr:hypothetical protein [Succiniclasticum sp.]
MAREQVYTAQLKDLGIWEDAFAPMVKELAQIDRRRTRLQKAWAATAPPGGKPSFLDPHYALIVQAERDALAFREALGLTPKALRRLRGAMPEAPAKDGGISAKLDALLAQAESYDVDSLIRHDEAGQPVPGLPGSALGENGPTVGTGGGDE